MRYGDLRSLMAGRHYLAAALSVERVTELPRNFRTVSVLQELAKIAPEALLTKEMRWAQDQAKRRWRPDNAYLGLITSGDLAFDRGVKVWQQPPANEAHMWEDESSCDCEYTDDWEGDPSGFWLRRKVTREEYKFGINAPDDHFRITDVEFVSCDYCQLEFLPIGAAYELVTNHTSPYWEVMSHWGALAFCKLLLEEQ